VPDAHAHVRLLRELCDEAMLALEAAGEARRPRCHVYPNSAEAIVLFRSPRRRGRVPLNPAYKEGEFRFYLEDTGARFLLVPPGQATAARSALPAGGIVIEAKIDAGRLRINHEGGGARGQSISGADDVALVLHTSGTTSRPKRVPLRHRNLTASIANVVSSYELGPGDVSMCVMPLFHVHGLVASALATLASGGAVVVPERFNPIGFWPLMETTRPTWFTASPTPHSLILSRLRDNRPAGTGRLRFVRSFSAALSAPQMTLMEERLGVPVLEGLRHDRGKSPDGIEPAAPGARARVGRPRHRRRHSHHRRGGLHPRRQRHGWLREQPRGERRLVRGGLVSHG
jgi:acyl-CoA synthetase (AMP-forming)/AMP-acid ligase II